MVVLLIRMKLVVLRHSMTGQRATEMISGGLFGLVLAAGTMLLAIWDFPVASLPFDLLGAVFALWTAGWLLGPVLFGGGDETLRPEHFTLLPVKPRRLASGLLGAAFAGLAPLVTIAAFAALVVVAATAGLGSGAVVVGVVAAVLQLVFCVLASKLGTAALAQIMRSKGGAALAALISAGILAVLNSGWVLVPLVEVALLTGFPELFSAWVHALPSGWGLVAVEAAGGGDWLTVAASLGGLAVLSLLSLLGWAALLRRRMTTRRASGRPARPGSGGWAGGPVTAVAAKELRTWTRDLLRFHYLCFALCYALAFCMLPLAIGTDIFLPWTGLVFAVWAAAMSANLYGEDGTALWGTMMIPGGARNDVRGRQLGWLLVAAPLTLVLTACSLAYTGSWELWPWPAALVPALLGGGAGVTVLVSVLRPVPMTDPHKRGGNLLENGTDFTQVLLVLVLVAATAAPAFFAVRLGPVWAGPVVGVLTGGGLAWLLGRIAADRLDAQAPAVLHRMRSGALRKEKAAFAWDRLNPQLGDVDLGLEMGLDTAPRGRRIYVLTALTLCWVPLVAQGVVPALMLATGTVNPSWFLALHLPLPLRWPTIWAMIGIGAALGLSGLYLLLKSRSEAQRTCEPTQAGE
ncbi:hypothetical protein ACFXJ8_15690 [Nonomuraea sp. NPDC059194]|uniref:hypothetical protein n=1 Tax=Nonomuraea sp. NPDC059194 TaxID=3346764 RepID=UPI0036CBAC68